MKQLLFIIILLGLGIWAYLHFYGIEPGARESEEQPHHLAKEGTFFVLTYTSIPTGHGIIGFEPGREVHLVRADHQKGRLIVSDGRYEAALKPSQLTNDIDVAAVARKNDEASQHQISASVEREEAAYARAGRDQTATPLKR